MSEDDVSDWVGIEGLPESEPSTMFATSDATFTIPDTTLHPITKSIAIFVLFIAASGFLYSFTILSRIKWHRKRSYLAFSMPCTSTSIRKTRMELRFVSVHPMRQLLSLFPTTVNALNSSRAKGWGNHERGRCFGLGRH